MNKPPAHIEYYKQLKEEPADTTEHPLDRFSKIEQKWATPFLESHTKLPDKVRNDLIEVLKLKETALSNLKETNPEFYGMAEAKGFYATTHYNLFDDLDEQLLLLFEFEFVLLFFKSILFSLSNNSTLLTDNSLSFAGLISLLSTV